MSQYDTITKTIGEVVITASKPSGGKPPSAADRLEAFLKWLSSALTKPDNSLPGAPGHPDNSLPAAPGRPDNSLPTQPGHPDQGLPPDPARPDQGLPGAQPGVDNELPSGGGRPTHPIAGVIGENAKEIAAIILKNTLCDPAQPK